MSCQQSCQNESNTRLGWPQTTGFVFTYLNCLFDVQNLEKLFTLKHNLDDPVPGTLLLKREEDDDDDMARKINFTEENYHKYSDNNAPLQLIGNYKM